MSADPSLLTPVRVLAWGWSMEHVESAVRRVSMQQASLLPPHAACSLAKVDRVVTSGACPIDPADPQVIAADCGAGWAYAVYPAGGVL